MGMYIGVGGVVTFNNGKKLKEVVDYAAIIGVFYILLYQIEALRNLCKAICEYAIEWFLPVELSEIKAVRKTYEILSFS